MARVNRPLTMADFRSARERLADKVVRTPAVLSNALSGRCGAPVWLKLEHRQATGSFKLRGATNAVALLSPDQKRRGVVACSTGNHGRALAFAANREGVHATICLSRLVPANKVSEIRRLGADVRIVGNSQDDAQEEVERLVATEGKIVIPPFDDEAIIAGQGTIGFEIVDDVSDVSHLLVPVSGGGLAAGTATVIKALRPHAKVTGVSMSRGAAMKASLEAGKPVLTAEAPSLADSLGGGIGLGNRLTFSMCAALLDDIVLLSEDEIADAVAHAYAEEREILEGAGAVAIGALLADKVRVTAPAVLLLSGQNIDMDLHRRIASGERGMFPEDATSLG